MKPSEASSRAIDAFCDSLWLEDGLSRNTLAAYRRDLSTFALWLAGRGRALNEASEEDLTAYIAERHGSGRASSANRRLTVLRRFYRLALRNHDVPIDPTR